MKSDTGGGGFIGSNLAERLLHDGYEVRVLDNFATGFRANLDGLDVRLLEGTAGRPSVVVTARGTGGGRSLLLCGHTDTVGGVVGWMLPCAGPGLVARRTRVSV